MNLPKFFEFVLVYPDDPYYSVATGGVDSVGTDAVEDVSSDNLSGNTHKSAGSIGVFYWTSELNEDATYVVFSSYYECAFIGVFPLVALCFLNYNIYARIRKSAQFQHR